MEKESTRIYSSKQLTEAQIVQEVLQIAKEREFKDLTMRLINKTIEQKEYRILAKLVDNPTMDEGLVQMVMTDD